MSDTPETDTKQHFMYMDVVECVEIDFARKLERERDESRRALDLIAEDCDAWLANQCDETCCEMIKLVSKFAKERLGEAKKM